jgi:hypothetical protein
MAIKVENPLEKFGGFAQTDMPLTGPLHRRDLLTNILFLLALSSMTKYIATTKVNVPLKTYCHDLYNYINIIIANSMTYVLFKHYIDT